MKVLQVISSIDSSSGGPSKSVSELGVSLARKKINIELITGVSSNPFLRGYHNSDLKVNYIQGKDWYKKLESRTLDGFDIFHGHGIWQKPIHSMSKLARLNDIPYIISPRGMLEPWALNQRKLKKKIALLLYQYKDISAATCIHCTAQMEAEHIRMLGFKNPIAIIPNGLDLSEYLISKKNHTLKKTLLFLSRIHPKKGIELLINAWGEIAKDIRKDWQVKIVGNGEKDYILQLINLISKKDLSNEIKFIDPVFGKDKITIFKSADLFVLPTYSENFGIVVAEALACCVPVITTKGTPWEDLSKFNAGWWIDIGEEELKIALIKAMYLSDEERRQMGINGRKLIEMNYTIEMVSAKMYELYSYLLSGSNKPDFIF
jgi:glycosyltransferase involved in cell wall biosynthesis